jgi:hypothetical protein
MVPEGDIRNPQQLSCPRNFPEELVSVVDMFLDLLSLFVVQASLGDRKEAHLVGGEERQGIPAERLVSPLGELVELA